MSGILSGNGVPSAYFFASHDGTPLYIDIDTGIAYFLDEFGVVQEIVGGAGDVFNLIAAGTQTANTAGTVLFSNSNGVTFGMSNSSIVTASHNGLTTAALSNHSHGNPTLNLTNISGTTASNSAGLTLSLSAGVGGGGGVAIAGGTQTGTSGTVVFSNSNGITFGMSNSSIITAAHNAITTGALSNHSHGVSFTSGSVAFQTLSFTNSNGISFNSGTQGIFGSHNAITTGMASNRGSDFVQATAAFAGTSASGTIASGGISVSIGPYITTGALSNHSHGVSFTSGSTVFQTLSFTNSNGISFNSGTQGIFGSHNALTTGAASDHSHGNPTLALTNLTGTTASNSAGLTLSLSAAAPGGGAGATVSKFFHMLGEPMGGTTSLTVGGSSVFVEPFILPVHVSASYLRFPMSAGHGSTTFASTANTTISLQQTITQFFCIYSQGVGGNSRSLQSIYSTSVSMALRVDYRVGAASGNQSCSHHFTYPATGNSSVTFSTSYAPAASSILRISTTHLTAYTGYLFMDVPYASLLTPGNYWIAFQSSSATATTGPAAMTAVTSRGSYVGLSQVSVNIREMGANTTVGSNMWFGHGHGWWTTNTFGATTASMALSHISTIANHPVIAFMLERYA